MKTKLLTASIFLMIMFLENANAVWPPTHFSGFGILNHLTADAVHGMEGGACVIGKASDIDATDGFDYPWDRPFDQNNWENRIGIYSVIDTSPYVLLRDVRSDIGPSIFRLKLFCWKSINEVRGNKLMITYYPPNISPDDVGIDVGYFWCYWSDYPEPNWTFLNEPIILQSDRLKYGTWLNLRQVLDCPTFCGEYFIPLKDAPIGIHPPWEPYGYVIITIGGDSRFCDFNKDSQVDMADFARIANRYGQSGEGLAEDVSGPDSIPDGNIDIYDLAEFCSEYLENGS